jgi:hypothetical protein
MMDWKSYANRKGVGLIRRSHSGQKDNCSAEIQRKEIKSSSADQGIEIIEYIEFIESSKSAANRKKYNQALRQAKKIGADHLFFYVTDREARNLTDVETNQNAVLSGELVLHYVKDRKCLHKFSPESDFQLREFQAVIDKSFSRRLSVRTRDSQAHKVEKGLYPGNKPVLGYIIQKAKDENGREMKRGAGLAPDPKDQNRRWAIEEFKLYSMGLSFTAIRDECVRQGLVPLSAIPTYRANSVEKRVKNPIYWGEFVWCGEIHKGIHQVFIPSDILRAAKIRREGGKAYGKRHFGEQGIFALNNWLKCGDPTCGCAIIFDPKEKINKSTGTKRFYPYYHCTDGKGAHGSLKGMTITEEVLWERLEQSLDDITITDLFAKQVAEALNQSREDARKATLAEMDLFEQKLVLIDEKKNKLIDAVLDNLISRDDMELKKKSLETERNQIVDRLRQGQLRINGRMKENAKSILELAINAKSLWKERSMHERLSFLKLILSNPTWDGRSVRYTLKKPFAILEEMKRNENWRRQATQYRNWFIQNPGYNINHIRDLQAA